MTPAAGVAQALVLAAYLWFAAAGIVLTAIDVRLRRLPDAIVLSTFAVLVVLLAVSSVLTGDAGAFLRAVAGAAAMLALYLVISLLSRGGLGFGDVKLAAVIGLATAWVGWEAVVVATVAAFVLGGLFGLVVLARRRGARGATVPFGPWMLAGAWVGILAGPPAWTWYAAFAGISHGP